MPGGVTEDFDFDVVSDYYSSPGPSGSGAGDGSSGIGPSALRVASEARRFVAGLADGVVTSIQGANEQMENIKDDSLMMVTLWWRLVKIVCLLVIGYAMFKIVCMLINRPSFEKYVLYLQSEQNKKKKKPTAAVSTKKE